MVNRPLLRRLTPLTVFRLTVLWLLVLWLATSAQAGQRGALAITGGAGVPLTVPEFEPDPPQIYLGCLGVDIIVLAPDRKRPKRGYFPTETRSVFSFSACGIGDVILVGGGGGFGGQWGTKNVYGTIQMVAGMGTYQQTYGPRRYQTVGLWVRPRAALGFPLDNGMSLEMGPTYTTVAPMLLTHQGRPANGQFGGVLAFEITVAAGNLGPRR